MKLIDSDGKIFGKINVIDFSIAVFIAVVLVVGLKIVFFQPKTVVYALVQLCEKQTTSLLPVNCGEVPYSFKDFVAKGTVFGSFKKPLTEVVNVAVKKSTGLKKNAFFLELRLKKDVSLGLEKDASLELKEDVLLELKITADKKRGGFYIQGQPLKVGFPLFLKKTSFELAGIIVDLRPEPINILGSYIPKEIVFEMYGQKNWTAEAIKIGDKAKDNNNNVLAEILDKKVGGAEIEVVSETGEVYRRLSPVFKDIQLKIKIFVRNENDQLIFQNQELKVGENLLIGFPNIYLFGTITNVK